MWCVDCVVLIFINLNNLLIVCGVLLLVYGICGNYFWDLVVDGGCGVEVMMNDLVYLWVGMLFVVVFDVGVWVVVVIVKDKLCWLFGW